MPRELMHWHVLERSKIALGQDAPEIAQALSQNPLAAKLGALLHDAPYFLNFGGSPFEQVAEILHGTHGEDTFAPMRSLAGAILNYTPAQQSILLACLAGMLSHIAADVIFHPLVYYFTGNYYDADLKLQHKARLEHRALEVWLDNTVRDNFVANDALLCKCLTALEPQTKQLIFGWLAEGLAQHSELSTVSNWQSAVSEMSRAQYLFTTNWSGALAALFRFGKLGELEALFSWRRQGKLPLFEAPINYKNPVSGEAFSTDLLSLVQLSVDQSLRYYRQFNLALNRQDFSIATISVGLSLNFGIAGATPAQSSYYHNFREAP